MERAIRVMDYAILIISAVDGIEGHTETVWNLLRQYHVPTFIFINKIDREGADIDGVMASIHKELSEDAVLVQEKITLENMPESIIEWIAERDEDLLEQYMEGALDVSAYFSAFLSMLKKNKPLCV